ncbi:cytochrome P450 89A2-like [Carex rostrata]
MENLLFYLFTLAISLSLTILLFSQISHHRKGLPLPPGPLAPLLPLRRSSFEIESFLRGLFKKHGPIVSVNIASRPAIFISDRTLAHQALIQHGATFAERPTTNAVAHILNSGQRSISSAKHGPLWRALRRNLMAEILQQSRVQMFAPARKWMLSILIDRLKVQMERDGSVVAMESFQFAMFCLLVLMCFGEKLDEAKIREIEEIQKQLMIYFVKIQVFSAYPAITKIIFRKRWNTILALRKRQEDLFSPLIRARKEKKEGKDIIYSYVDSLLDLKIPEDGGRKLTEGEIVSLCSEFLTGGTDTTATALQWIMANLVKQPEIQQKLWTEIEEAMGKDSDEVKEEDLQKMVYLKAVVLEGLRRHPPGHFVLPHTVSEDFDLNGYHIPKDAPINFAVAEIGCNDSTWSDPFEFKPERFTEGGEGEVIDLTGTKEIKMMPFGAGRRICPGMALALMHLEYFVANLVKEFKWEEIDEEKVDLTEKLEFTTVMKKPLRARIVPRK